jgi:cytochrome c peroxidase
MFMSLLALRLLNPPLTSLTLLATLITLSACSSSPAQLSNAPTPVSEAEGLITLLAETGGAPHYLLPNAQDLPNLPQSAKNPLTPEKVQLGKMLFHETALSFVSKNDRNGSWSCASCHFSAAGFQDQRVQSIADGGAGDGSARHILTETTPHSQLDAPNLRSPSILNLGYQHNVLWNGMSGGVGDNLNYPTRWDKTKPHGFNHLGLDGVETQAIIALGAHRQTHDHMLYDSATEPLSVLNNYPEYLLLFSKAFPDQEINRETIGLAIAAYERTVLSTQAPFQRFLKGDKTALNAEELQGAQLFFGKAQCATCHTGPALNQENYYALGLKDMEVEFGPAPDEATRKGRGGFTGVKADEYKFKVPQLYNLKNATSLGHGGSFQSRDEQSAVEQIIRYKLKGQPENPEVPATQLAPEFTGMAKVNFTEAEIQALVGFIENGLYDPNLSRYEPTQLPSGQRIINNDP